MPYPIPGLQAQTAARTPRQHARRTTARNNAQPNKAPTTSATPRYPTCDAARLTELAPLLPGYYRAFKHPFAFTVTSMHNNMQTNAPSPHGAVEGPPGGVATLPQQHRCDNSALGRAVVTGPRRGWPSGQQLYRGNTATTSTPPRGAAAGPRRMAVPKGGIESLRQLRRQHHEIQAHT